MINDTSSCDTFIKSNPISFRGLNEGDKKKVKYFINDLYKAFYIKDDTSLETIKKTVRKYDRDLDVKLIGEYPEEPPQGMVAFYTYNNRLDKEKGVIVRSGPTIYIDDDAPCFDQKLSFFVSTVHEFTHAIQNATKEYSKASFETRYFDCHKDNIQNAFKNLSMASDASRIFEMDFDDLIYASGQAIRISSNEPYGKALDKIAVMRGYSDSESYIKSSVNRFFKYGDDAGIKLDKKLILEYSALHLEHESEAYEVSKTCFAKAMENSPKRVNIMYQSGLQAELFNRASGILRQMAKKY